MSKGGRPPKLAPEAAIGTGKLNFPVLTDEAAKKQRAALMQGSSRKRPANQEAEESSDEERENDDESQQPRGRRRIHNRLVVNSSDSEDDDDDDDDDHHEDGERQPDGTVPGRAYPALIPARLNVAQRQGKAPLPSDQILGQMGTIEEAVDSFRSRNRAFQLRKTKINFANRNFRPDKYGSIKEVDLRMKLCSDEGDDCFTTARDLSHHYVLKCTVCNKIVNSKLSAFNKHRDGIDHTNAVAALDASTRESLRMGRLMRDFFVKNPTMRGLGVDDATHQFRLEAVAAAFRAGIPISKLDDLRPFLQKWSKHSMTGSSHLGIYISALAAAELAEIRELVKTCKSCWVIFDGTTRVDEVLAVVFRFVTEDFTIVQKLVSLAKYKDVKSHEKLATAIMKVLSTYGVLYADGCLGWSNDRAATNLAALDYLTMSYGGLRMSCLSHTLTHVGEHAKTEELVRWGNDFIGMFSQSGGNNNAVHLWQEVMGIAWRHPGNTRW